MLQLQDVIEKICSEKWWYSSQEKTKEKQNVGGRNIQGSFGLWICITGTNNCVVADNDNDDEEDGNDDDDDLDDGIKSTTRA